jgi:hypothetical protein
MNDVVDQDAFRRAIEMLLQLEPTWEGGITKMLEERPFEEVGEWASGVCQAQNLRLKPWQCAPSSTANVENPRDVYGVRPAEVGLLRKLLSLGLSRFEPDPLAAMHVSSVSARRS